MSDRTIDIAPSILSADFSRLGEEIEAVKRGGATILHVDVMDGHFVPNISFGPLIPAAIHKTLPNAFLDVHLMVTDPLKWINVFADSGASSITFHIEVGNVTEIISAIRKRGIRVGIALKPDTDVTSVFEFVDQIDMVLIVFLF